MGVNENIIPASGQMTIGVFGKLVNVNPPNHKFNNFFLNNPNTTKKN